MKHAWLGIAVGVALWGCGDTDEGKGDGDSGIGDAAGDAGGDTTAGGGTGAGTAADSAPGGDTAGADEGGGGENDPPISFDLGALPDAPDIGCGPDGGNGDLEYSYIWIANSTQNTVSKIDTQTLVEQGRYYTRTDQFGNPSRTSVNLSGDVAVANRSGGLTKFYANPEDCIDLDGNGSIDTSTGPADIRPWASEECRAWHTPFSYSSQRPVAWTQGDWNAGLCRYENEKVWTTGLLAGVVEVVLVDGETGVVEDSVMVPEVVNDGFGFYGGAVDAEGNFWASQLGGGQLIRVPRNDLGGYELWAAPYGGYGMTVGASGYVFTCSSQVGRFDPVTETWMGATVGGAGGCMEDANGILWMASDPLVGVDVQTLTVVHSHDLPQYVHGVSIDFDGYVWGVSMSTQAYKVDAELGTYDIVDGLVGPYTYSDMTGFALSSVGGGGAPSG